MLATGAVGGQIIKLPTIWEFFLLLWPKTSKLALKLTMREVRLVACISLLCKASEAFALWESVCFLLILMVEEPQEPLKCIAK